MKTSIFLLLVTTVLIFSCEKTKFESTGTIVGADLSMCACCGGYFMDIDETRYRFEKAELPADFTFSDNQLPLKVELNWKIKIENCTGLNWIKISEIRVIK